MVVPLGRVVNGTMEWITAFELRLKVSLLALPSISDSFHWLPSFSSGLMRRVGVEIVAAVSVGILQADNEPCSTSRIDILMGMFNILFNILYSKLCNLQQF